MDFYTHGFVLELEYLLDGPLLVNHNILWSKILHHKTKLSTQQTQHLSYFRYLSVERNINATVEEYQPLSKTHLVKSKGYTELKNLERNINATFSSWTQQMNDFRYL